MLAVLRLPSLRGLRPRHSRLGIETGAPPAARATTVAPARFHAVCRLREPCATLDVTFDELLERLAQRANPITVGTWDEETADEARTAVKLDDAVLTDNVDDFEAPGVPVETY